MYTGPGGGLYTGPGGGLYTGPGGGLYTGPGGGLYAGPGGGLYTGPGGGAYAGPGGGLYTGPGRPYCSNIPPREVLRNYLENRGMKNEAYDGRIVPAPVPRIPPMPVYVVPPAPRGGGLDPWILLAGQPVQPAPMASPLDLMRQMLLLQQLAAARPRPQAAPAPAVIAPAPNPPTGDGWMSGFIKGVKPSK